MASNSSRPWLVMWFPNHCYRMLSSNMLGLVDWVVFWFRQVSLYIKTIFKKYIVFFACLIIHTFNFCKSVLTLQSTAVKIKYIIEIYCKVFQSVFEKCWYIKVKNVDCYMRKKNFYFCFVNLKCFVWKYLLTIQLFINILF